MSSRGAPKETGSARESPRNGAAVPPVTTFGEDGVGSAWAGCRKAAPGWIPRRSRETLGESVAELEENLRSDPGVAPLAEQLNRAVEVDVAVGDSLGKVHGVSGFDQLVQAPARDLVPVALIVFSDLCHVHALDPPCFVLT